MQRAIHLWCDNLVQGEWRRNTYSILSLCPVSLVDVRVQLVESLVALHSAPALHVLCHWCIAKHTTALDPKIKEYKTVGTIIP